MTEAEPASAVRHRRARAGLALGFAAAFAALPATAQNASGADAAAAIVAVRTASNAAIAAHDLAALRQTWVEDIQVTGSSGAVFASGEAMATGFADSFADPEFVTYRRTPDAVTIGKGDAVAAESGTWVGIWNKPDGEMNLRGTYMAQWRLDDAGWRVRSEVFVALTCSGSDACEDPAAGEPPPHQDKIQRSHFFEVPMLVGVVDESDLRQAPFAEWFEAGYEGYAPDVATMASLADSLAAPDITIEAFFGTWCDDSTRELPRLLRTLNDTGFAADRLSIVALSDNPGKFKTSPDRQELDSAVHRTPTFIVRRNGAELGRIVERPAASLEADLVAILGAEQPHRPYGAESALHARYLAGDIALIAAPTQAFLDDLEALGDTDSLWHYAYYDLLFNGRPDDAANVLRVFLTLHPDSARGYQLLGQAESDLGNTAAALFALRRALAIEPGNRAAQRLEREILETTGS
jgi:ketosteroid isomerase-like protein